MSAWYSWFNMLVGLVVIINPLMGVSAFATLAGGESPAQRRVTARIAALTIGVVLTVAALGGDALLAFFGIGIPEFQVGGGVLILLMAVSMMNAQIGSARQTEEEADELDLVALASPGDLQVDETADGYVIGATLDQLVDAGMLKQRLLALAVAHGVTISVDVTATS